MTYISDRNSFFKRKKPKDLAARLYRHIFGTKDDEYRTNYYPIYQIIKSDGTAPRGRRKTMTEGKRWPVEMDNHFYATKEYYGLKRGTGTRQIAFDLDDPIHEPEAHQEHKDRIAKVCQAVNRLIAQDIRRRGQAEVNPGVDGRFGGVKVWLFLERAVSNAEAIKIIEAIEQEIGFTLKEVFPRSPQFILPWRKDKITFAGTGEADRIWNIDYRTRTRNPHAGCYDMLAVWDDLTQRNRIVTIPIKQVLAAVDEALAKASTVDCQAQDVSEDHQEPLSSTKKPTKARKAGEKNLDKDHRLGRQKGQAARILQSFWLGEHNPPDSLNEMLVMTARYCLVGGLDRDETEEVLAKFVDELPDTSFSTRLSSGSKSEKNSDILSQAICDTIKAVGEDGLQGVKGPKKLKKSLEAWKRKGFLPWDKTTWKSNNTQHTHIHLLGSISVQWTPEEREIIRTKWLPLLRTDQKSAEAYLEDVILAAKAMPEMPMTYLRTLAGKYGIKMGMKAKRTAVMKLLLDLGWLYLRAKHQFCTVPGRRGRARGYGVGEALVHHFQKQANTTAKVEIEEIEGDGQTWDQDAAESIYSDPRGIPERDYVDAVTKSGRIGPDRLVPGSEGIQARMVPR